MSEADSGWFLRHRDGVEHGPFQFVDLITAARSGNIAEDTCVRHQTHTRAQWVFAIRVPQISQAMERGTSAQDPAQNKTATQNPATQHRDQQSQHAVTQTQRPDVQPASAPSAQTPSPRRPVTGRPTQQTGSETQQPPAGPRPPTSLGDSLRQEDTPRQQRSLFRRAQTSASSRDSDAAVSESPEPFADIDSAIRSHREEAFPVPRTFVDAAQTLVLDFRFRRFVTPWIIKILWGMTLLLAVLSISKLGYEFFLEPSMPNPGQEGGRSNWQFGPLHEQPLLLMRILIFSISALLTLMVVMCVRVICEMILVLFLAGGDVRQVQQLLKQQKQ